MKGYTISRKLRGAQYDITVRNESGAQKGVKSIKVDGVEISGNVVKHSEGHHTVEVVM